MGSQFAGNPSNTSGSLPGSLAISSSTAANPTVINLGSAHGLVGPTQVDVYSHQGNLPANGVYLATPTSTTAFSIPVNTTGGTAGGATGRIISLAPGASYLIPADGDASSAASVDVAFEALGDRTAWLPLASGAYKLVTSALNSNTDDTQAAWDSFTFTADSTWTSSTGGLPIITLASYPMINQGDIIDLDIDLTLNWLTDGATDFSAVQLGLFASFNGPGVSIPTPVRVPGSVRQGGISPPGGAGSLMELSLPTHMSARIVAGTGFPTGNSLAMRVYIQARTFDRAFITSQLANMTGDFNATAIVYRATGVSQ